MNERFCKTCRYGETVEVNDEIVAVKCMWGPPGVGFDFTNKRFTKVILNMHPEEWCYQWARKLEVVEDPDEDLKTDPVL